MMEGGSCSCYGLGEGNISENVSLKMQGNVLWTALFYACFDPLCFSEITYMLEESVIAVRWWEGEGGR